MKVRINHAHVGFVLSMILCLIFAIINYNSKDKTSSANSEQFITAKVINVADGDTITVLTSNNEPVKVRLQNIDAPEKKQEYGNQALKFTKNLLHGKIVDLKISGQDKYKRKIAEVFIGDVNINKEIVKHGWAWAYRDYLKDKSYIQLEQQAKNAKLGLWAGNNPIEPSRWRKLNK